MNLKRNMTLCMLAMLSVSCASVPEDVPTKAQTLPADARQVAGGELKDLFTDVSESYTSIDIPGVNSNATWRKNGEFSVDWAYKEDSGRATGTWYVDGENRCIEFSPVPEGWEKLECTTVYQTGDNYITVNPDGSLHGIHVLSPL